MRTHTRARAHTHTHTCMHARTFEDESRNGLADEMRQRQGKRQPDHEDKTARQEPARLGPCAVDELLHVRRRRLILLLSGPAPAVL